MVNSVHDIGFFFGVRTDNISLADCGTHTKTNQKCQRTLFFPNEFLFFLSLCILRVWFFNSLSQIFWPAERCSNHSLDTG